MPQAVTIRSFQASRAGTWTGSATQARPPQLMPPKNGVHCSRRALSTATIPVSIIPQENASDNRDPSTTVLLLEKIVGVLEQTRIDECR